MDRGWKTYSFERGNGINGREFREIGRKRRKLKFGVFLFSKLCKFLVYSSSRLFIFIQSINNK